MFHLAEKVSINFYYTWLFYVDFSQSTYITSVTVGQRYYLQNIFVIFYKCVFLMCGTGLWFQYLAVSVLKVSSALHTEMRQDKTEVPSCYNNEPFLLWTDTFPGKGHQTWYKACLAVVIIIIFLIRGQTLYMIECATHFQSQMWRFSGGHRISVVGFKDNRILIQIPVIQDITEWGRFEFFFSNWQLILSIMLLIIFCECLHAESSAISNVRWILLPFEFVEWNNN